ncbi:MAG: serine hydrolase domain-containing protein [Ignavibacteriota bacterium]
MKSYLNKSILIVLLFAVFVDFSFSQENKNKLFDEYLNEYLLIKNAPSISAGLLEQGKITWLNAFGKADVENNVSANTSSLYRIASISKSITAIAVLQLWERGLISLDTDARTYITTFPVKRYKFSIRQILNHTSGIRNYKDGEFDNKKYFATTEDAFKLFAYDSLNFEPGTKYEYTTLGYSLLAAIVENVTKTSFENYLRNNIFLPAGMNSTLIDKQRDIIPNRVRGYEKNAESKIVNAPLADISVKVAGGGLLSTSKDILLFAKAILENKLLKQSTLDMMIRRSKLKSGKEIDYGLGFSLTFENDSLRYISHSGAGTGFSAMLLIDLKQKNASVDLINIRARNLGEPAKDILEMLNSGVLLKPTKTLSEELMKTYLVSGIDSVNRKLTNIYGLESELYTLNADEVIFFANNLIELNRIPNAIIYLKEALKLYSKSFKVLAAIADSYLKDSNNGLALKYYRLAAQIDNTNYRVNNLIKRLSSN